MLGLGLGLALAQSRGGGAFNPLSLAPTAWYDPSDLSTLFQDTAGTTPVTTDGQAVARINDKSGNGLHLLQATAAWRPLYKTSGGKHWLAFDGVDDGLGVNAAALRIVGNLTLSVGAFKSVAASEDPLVSCTTNITAINPYLLEFNTHATNAVPWFVAADAGLETDQATTAIGAINTAMVVSARRTIGATVELSVNGTRETLAHTKVPTADASSVFNMGVRNGGTAYLAGRIYGAFVFNKLLSNGELAGIEASLAAKL